MEGADRCRESEVDPQDDTGDFDYSGIDVNVFWVDYAVIAFQQSHLVRRALEEEIGGRTHVYSNAMAVGREQHVEFFLGGQRVPLKLVIQRQIPSLKLGEERASFQGLFSLRSEDCIRGRP